VDTKTKDYYTQNAHALLAKYAQATDVNAKHFGFAFPQHIAQPFRVLDIGAGTGRDLLFLLERGYDAFGIEPVDAIRNAALGQSLTLHSRLFPGSICNILPAPLSDSKFDGVLCSAVLQHVEKRKLVSACVWIKSLLNKQGRLFLSTPAAENDTSQPPDTDSRDEHGRIFNRWPKDFLILLFERLNLRLIDTFTSPDSLGRANAGWHNFVFALEGEGTKVGLERIEDIIFRDKKTSTYKIALIKSLCEIAISGERDVHFTNAGVHVPLHRVSKIWFRDYRALLAAENSSPLPQISSPRVAFEAELFAIANALKTSKNAEPNLEALQQAALRAIGNTILKNPVQYAGGTNGSPFTKGSIAQTQTIVVQHDVWRELVLFGRWLKDALVFEWARWSANLARKKNLNPQLVLQETIRVLTSTQEQARDTAIARRIFEKAAQNQKTQCTWTGKTLRDFDIDHILPYAHFGNNALWNLVPTAPDVNNEKRDCAPSIRILENSQQRLFGAWRVEHNQSPELFESDATTFTGVSSLFTSSSSWENPLFDALWESVALWQSANKRRVWDAQCE
jgi:SAM-dependent methyltransferase